MAERDQSLWLLLPKPVRELPVDLAFVTGFVFLTCAVVLVPGVNDTPLRIVFGLPFTLFLPGYALVATLFPEDGSSPAEGSRPDTGSRDAQEQTDESSETLESLTSNSSASGIDGIERVALSFGLSIAVTPLIGLILNFTPWGIRLVPILLGISAVTLGLVVLAASRRQELPAEERFRVPYHSWIAAGRAELFEPESRLDGALNILLAVSLLLALGAVGYAVVVPPQGESFTEFYLLSENDDGELVASEYPTEFELGESQQVVVGVENHENEPVTYSVVVQLQEVEIVNNETTVRQRQELDRFSSPTLADNETWQRPHDIQPTMTGERLRVQYLLYRDEPPSTPTEETAYRELHLWITV